MSYTHKAATAAAAAARQQQQQNLFVFREVPAMIFMGTSTL
jgi:hypothetical protein